MRDEARARSRGRCIVCGRACRGHLHHVFDERLFPELAKVAENLVLICAEDHDRHTSAFRRIRRSELPRCAIRLARGVGERIEHLRRPAMCAGRLRSAAVALYARAPTDGGQRDSLCGGV